MSSHKWIWKVVLLKYLIEGFAGLAFYVSHTLVLLYELAYDPGSSRMV